MNPTDPDVHIKLIMNVRDDAEVLPRCLDSALQVISSWLVIDTGSNDNTMEVVEERLGHLPGRMTTAEWISHAHNRSLLISMAKQELPEADYCLMLDSDMELVIDESLSPPESDKDLYFIDLDDGGVLYPLPLLTNMKQDWSYNGAAHAFLAAVNANATAGRIRKWKLIDHGGGGHTTREGKLETDLENLKRAVADNPADTRSWYYLGQTYRDLEMWNEAVLAYKFRSGLGGWEEEIYSSLFNAGIILTRKFNIADGLQVLLDAWRTRPSRAEPLRALASVCNTVADQIPYPEDDILFIRKDAYVENPDTPVLPCLTEGPGFRKFVKTGVKSKLTARDVTAIIPTRGNVPLKDIVDSLPYDDIIIYNNSDPNMIDYKVFSRYAAITMARNSVIYWQDDDIIFTEHDKLLEAYEPGIVVCNMDQAWIKGAGYVDGPGLVGAGSLCDIDIPGRIFEQYFEHYPFDDDMLYECDFAFGTLAPYRRVDLGYVARPFADDPDRLYQQSWQTTRKWKMIDRCRKLKEELALDGQASLLR